MLKMPKNPQTTFTRTLSSLFSLFLAHTLAHAHTRIHTQTHTRTHTLARTPRGFDIAIRLHNQSLIIKRFFSWSTQTRFSPTKARSISGVFLKTFSITWKPSQKLKHWYLNANTDIKTTPHGPHRTIQPSITYSVDHFANLKKWAESIVVLICLS